MFRTLASTRSAAARAARTSLYSQRRTFIRPTAALQADLVQDLYVRELKAYKTPATGANDAKGHVQEFTPPKAPASPEETNIAQELSAYESQAVEVEGQASPEEPASAVEEDWFEEEPEESAGASH